MEQRMGRPRIKGEAVCLKLGERELAELRAIARAQDKSLAAVVREVLRLGLEALGGEVKP